MKVDVIIIGSGIAGLSLASALGRLKLKTFVIAPDISESKFEIEGLFESETITDLPKSYSTKAALDKELEYLIDSPFSCIDGNLVYDFYLKKCAENGVGMMHGKVETLVAYRKTYRVDWRPNSISNQVAPINEMYAPCVIDASGALSAFSCSADFFQSSYAIRISEDVKWEAALFENPVQHETYFSYLRILPSSDDCTFELVAISHQAVSEETLKKELEQRLSSIIPIDILPDDSNPVYYVRPVIKKHGNLSETIAFGDAAAMAHPLSGQSTARVLELSPRFAKEIMGVIKQSPKQIVKELTTFLENEDTERQNQFFLDLLDSKEGLAKLKRVLSQDSATRLSLMTEYEFDANLDASLRAMLS